MPSTSAAAAAAAAAGTGAQRSFGTAIEGGTFGTNVGSSIPSTTSDPKQVSNGNGHGHGHIHGDRTVENGQGGIYAENDGKRFQIE